jgi:hypothetical protein
LTKISLLVEQELPEHSTFSKNRHGRFWQSGAFRRAFEEIVRRCLEAGFVAGRNGAVDGTLVGANASQQSRVPTEKPVGAVHHARTVQECLTELERRNPAVDLEEREKMSTTDPDATWAIKSGPAVLGRAEPGFFEEDFHNHSFLFNRVFRIQSSVGVFLGLLILLVVSTSKRR